MERKRERERKAEREKERKREEIIHVSSQKSTWSLAIDSQGKAFIFNLTVDK